MGMGCEVDEELRKEEAAPSGVKQLECSHHAHLHCSVCRPNVMQPTICLLQVVNKERSGAAADVWSLGIIVWELVSGQNISACPPLGVTSQLAPGARNALRMPPGASPAAVRVFEACTKVNPRARPTAAQVVAMLSDA